MVKFQDFYKTKRTFLKFVNQIFKVLTNVCKFNKLILNEASEVEQCIVFYRVIIEH